MKKIFLRSYNQIAVEKLVPDEEQYHQKLNIVAILTIRKKKKSFFQLNYIFGLHMQEAIFNVNTIKKVTKIYIKMVFKIW